MPRAPHAVLEEYAAAKRDAVRSVVVPGRVPGQLARLEEELAPLRAALDQPALPAPFAGIEPAADVVDGHRDAR